MAKPTSSLSISRLNISLGSFVLFEFFAAAFFNFAVEIPAGFFKVLKFRAFMVCAGNVLDDVSESVTEAPSFNGVDNLDGRKRVMRRVVNVVGHRSPPVPSQTPHGMWSPKSLGAGPLGQQPEP